MVQIAEDGSYQTFVNLFRTRPETQQRVIDILIRISDEVACVSPGFRSASTHASADGRLVLNYLQWRSVEDLVAMQSSRAFRSLAREFGGLLDSFEEFPSRVAHIRETDA